VLNTNLSNSRCNLHTGSLSRVDSAPSVADRWRVRGKKPGWIAASDTCPYRELLMLHRFPHG
jgi:hypothetical protein